MRIAALADLHGHLPDTPACDVLVIAGDVTPTTDHDSAFQARWLRDTFAPWLERQPAGAAVGIAGNHDFVFERAPELVPDLPWTYLEDSGATIGGVSFWGSPWTPWFFGWAFNAPEGDLDETFLHERYAPVPADTDVLVIHGPPSEFGDLTTRGQHVGSVAELELIDRIGPRLAIFGHIHEGRGAWEIGATRMANVSYVDVRYEPYPDAIVVYDV